MKRNEKRDKKIVELFKSGLDKAKIGRIYKLSRERIRQIIKKA